MRDVLYGALARWQRSYPPRPKEAGNLIGGDVTTKRLVTGYRVLICYPLPFGRGFVGPDTAELRFSGHVLKHHRRFFVRACEPSVPASRTARFALIVPLRKVLRRQVTEWSRVAAELSDEAATKGSG